ncbi:hypothetical protein [Blastococcus deserti]|uniref:Uncharacterized protein n=1 Tax=Blastococcus deserti TaxID=2259033 RepID=A0ABW4X9A4_9ACTN
MSAGTEGLVTNNEKPRTIRRIWVPQVAVDVEALRIRLDVAEARGLDPPGRAVAGGVRGHLEKARAAAFRLDPLPRRLANWWRGTLVETAYRHMHAAEAHIVDLYDEQDLQAEIPLAVARAQTALHREDLRQWTVEGLRALPPAQLRPQLRRILTDSFSALDAKHGQLRNFRNILLLAALLISVLVIATLAAVSTWPHVMPLCFPNEIVVGTDPLVKEQDGLNCPTRSDTESPSRGDVLVVALLGLLGGALAASVSIRNLKGTMSPYDVPVALALLKVPLGAFTAVLALVAIRADFVPGLSSLDSQEQILAYALVFGFAQQLFTRLLDQRAQTLLEHLPSKDAADEPPRPPPPPTPAVPTPEPAETPADQERTSRPRWRRR